MLKLTNKTRVACVLCAVALCFGIALAGCSSGSSSSAASSASSEAASSESASASADSSAATEVAVPEEVASAAEATKGIVQNNDTSAAADFDTLPTSAEEEATTPESGKVEEGLDDASKAPSNVTLVMTAGVQAQVPANWFISQDADGFVFQNPEGTVIGFLYGFPKQSGMRYDVESMAKSVPCNFMDMGYTNVEILGCSAVYSDKGTLVGADVHFLATYNGVQYSHYCLVLESASYINCLEVHGTVNEYYAYFDTIQAIVDSVCYDPSEAI